MRYVFRVGFVILALLLTVTIPAGAEETWEKYSDNSHKSFMSADDFYEKVVDKNDYKETLDAKLNVREKTTFKKMTNAYKKFDIPVEYGGVGVHPDRQMYVFATTSKDGKSRLTAHYDAEKEMMMGKTTTPSNAMD
ncbi:hypothetical protein JOC54_002715 [Alkalihalobacillus xiaoxiensis]|uniref:DUF3887 domain-containing protein n=1 Tax=Shouchella xiaoxiensis TaxID=766895 RepID=A0ABS2SW29_9BACI|nr:hypothetical protein [Shouchella xiaoxiensis]MBM7839435.1 hypothetical protein [Shouchella xiaoxiensis]